MGSTQTLSTYSMEQSQPHQIYTVDVKAMKLARGFYGIIIKGSEVHNGLTKATKRRNVYSDIEACS